jgi:hypothetical protein
MASDVDRRRRLAAGEIAALLLQPIAEHRDMRIGASRLRQIGEAAARRQLISGNGATSRPAARPLATSAVGPIATPSPSIAAWMVT